MRITISIAILWFIFSISCTNKQAKINSEVTDNLKLAHKIEILEYQKTMNEEFSDSKLSPLDSADLEHFDSLNFYAPDFNYRVKAKFLLAEGEKVFNMPTTTDRLPEYVKYGILKFSILGKDLELCAYQNIELVKKEAYKDYLFIPFTDLSNGFETYGGGRYIDIQYNGEESVILNFNKAYNPYCAYSGRWSCPIPPEENHLETEIKAGVRSYH